MVDDEPGRGAEAAWPESLTVTIQARYFWQDAAEAHTEAERGHTRGKIVLVVDEDLAAALEV